MLRKLKCGRCFLQVPRFALQLVANGRETCTKTFTRVPSKRGSNLTWVRTNPSTMRRGFLGR